MQCTRLDAGENHFTVQVPVQPGQEYAYKFKVGDGSDWVLDKHASICKSLSRRSRPQWR